jgi:3-oxoacid CoA-transferase subunit A
VKGDPYGNLVFRKTTRNFSTSWRGPEILPLPKVEQLVPLGDLDPDQIHVPGIYVHRIFQGAKYEKRIERRTMKIRE